MPQTAFWILRFMSRVSKLLPSGIWNAQMYSAPFERVKATRFDNDVQSAELRESSSCGEFS
jgi:hypothetical protein